MVPICRKHLFSSLDLVSTSISNSGHFSDLLLVNPDIARYVRSLNYKLYNPFTSSLSDHELTLLNILKVRSPLKSIELFSPGLDWNDYPESIRLSLLSLIELPTVTHLDIRIFKRFPATAISGCTNLINLQFGDIEWTLPDSEFDHVIPRSKIPTPAFLNIKRRTHGFAALLISASLHTVGLIDFSHVQTVIFQVEFRGDTDNINKLIKLTRRLRYVEIKSECLALFKVLSLQNFDRKKYFVVHFHPFELAGLGESLAISASRTLTSLELRTTSIIVDNDHLDPLCGLSRELGFIAGNNILEVLRLDVWFTGASSYLTHFELWSAFDSMLTDSGAFPVLRRVSVDFGWFSRYWSETAKDAILELERLKENKFFPRLVESEAVKFSFSTTDTHKLCVCFFFFFFSKHA